jgi:ElaB/YqjD/DUF883 family membrane-anchored ribosome-binding protein
MKKVSLENLNEQISKISKSGKSFIEEQELERRVDQIKEEAKTVIRKHPIASIGVGIFVGYLIGRLLNRD